MGLNSTPSGERIHIGFLRENAMRGNPVLLMRLQDSENPAVVSVSSWNNN